MNKAEIAGRVGLSRSAAGEWVDAVFETLAKVLAAGQDVRIVGFGTFGTTDRPARTGRNRRTDEPVSIVMSTVPEFKLGRKLRDAVNAGGGS